MRVWTRARRLGAAGIPCVSLLVASLPCALALNPALDVSQYAHTAWRNRDGFSEGTVVAIAQTPDGYLWLGTEFDLLRFDGVRYVRWKSPDGQQLPSSYVRSLLAGRDGTLWIGTFEGLASWKAGRLTRYAELAGQTVGALVEDRGGTVWAAGHGSAAGRLCAIRAGNVQCHGSDGSFGQNIVALHEDRAGSLWVGGTGGLWRWTPGAPKRFPMPDRVDAFGEEDDGTLLIGMHSGVKRFHQERLAALPLAAGGSPLAATAILRDREGSVWIGTAQGLVHVHQGRTDVFGRADGLSGNYIEKIFEDREGNIWVATIDGLDRFRDLAVPTISVKQGLSHATVVSVLPARDGSIWLGTLDGLNRWQDGRITVYRAKSDAGLPDDEIQSLFQGQRDEIWVSSRRGAVFFENDRFHRVSSVPGQAHWIDGDDAGNVWLSQDDGLFRVRGSTVGRIPWATLGHRDYVRSIVADPAPGGLWLAFLDGGIAYFQDGRITATYTAADGLGKGRIRGLQRGVDGALWASTESGASRLKNGRIATLTRENGLPCDAAIWALEDDEQALWIYMACGLVRIARSEIEAWAAAADKDSGPRVRVTVFDASDGVRSHSTSTGYGPSVAKTRDGKLWFLPWDGVSVIDPRRLSMNSLPPPVHIEQITANRTTYDVAPDRGSALQLPALIRNLQIDYTAPSLAAPEKVLFRYKLENWDRDWQDVGIRRQAFYGNLPPGKYRFHVIACNNSGLWNETGAVLEFAIAPAYYQTAWFGLAIVGALAAILSLLYSSHSRQLRRQFNMRVEERVGERTRIARDLHDTLLQSFQGVLMKFDAFTGQLQDRPELQETLEGMVEQARQAITEGRDAVQGLRSSMLSKSDLTKAIGALTQQLIADLPGPKPDFQLQVRGEPAEIVPVVLDEVYRIVSEALRNAFRHAGAKHIVVEIEYGEKHFRVRVSDDGKGIAPATVGAGGSEGHYGLSGMRERAKAVGAKLTIRSRLNSGTEAEISIPTSIACVKPPARRWRTRSTSPS